MADYTVGAGTTQSARISMSGIDTLTVEATGTLSVSANAQSVRFNNTTTNGVIDNSGTIENTASGGRAIRIESGVGTSFTGTITNEAGGVIQSDDDGIQIQSTISSGSIEIENHGDIKSTAGQAIDFASANGAAVSITNTGTIGSGSNDAIRTGADAEIINSGTIDGGTATGFTPSTDGVDFRAFGGSVHNLAGGIITADRHAINAGDDGVAGTISVINDAGGLIIGRNGSGVGSDGGGSVTNYGTITGAFANDPASDENSPAGEDIPDGIPDGDGDGIDFDFEATIINYGIIQGTGAGGNGSDGLPNTSEGIAAGGGSITNHSGATIIGAGIGILIDDSSRGNAPALTAIVNDGTIEGTGLVGIQIISSFADTIQNNGTITGGNGTAILFGDGDNTLILGENSVIDGVSDGGRGTNTLEYLDWTSSVKVDLGRGRASGADGVLNFQNVSGSDGADTLTGSASANVLSGNDGDDRITGGAGDTLNGGADDDVLTISGTPAAIDGGTGTDTLIVGGDASFAAGSVTGVERIVVGDGVTADFSLLEDGLTISSRSAAGGGVTIIGSDGADRISARLGNDLLNGGAGDDTLIGGSGDDTFAFDGAGFGRDTVARFADGLDRIEIGSALAADFGDLTIVDQGSRTVIDFGNGDMIVLRGIDASSLDAGDFLFV